MNTVPVQNTLVHKPKLKTKSYCGVSVVAHRFFVDIGYFISTEGLMR